MSGLSQSNKRIAKNTMFMYVQFFVNLAIGLYTSRVVLQVLGVSDYGLYAVVGGVLSMFTFLSSSLGGATTRFLNYEMGLKEGDINRAFNINVVLHLFFALLVFVAAEIGGLFYIFNYLVVEEGRLGDAVFVFEVAIITACLGINNTPFNALFRAKEKFGFLAILDIVQVLIRLGLIVMLKFYDGNSLRLYALIMSFTTLSSFIVYRIYANHHWSDIIKFKFIRGWHYYKEVLVFGWWNLLSTLAVMARSSGSDILLNAFFGTAVNGAYALSRSVADYATNVSSYFEGASVPQITQSYSGNDMSRCSYLVNKMGKISLLLYLAVFFPLYIELDFVLHLWLGEVPDGVLLLCKINLILGFVSLTSSGLVTYINATGKIMWFKILMSSLLILCLPVGYFLFKIGLPYYILPILFIVADIIHRVFQFILLKKITNYDSMSYIKEAYTRPFIIIVIMILVLYMYDLSGLGSTPFAKLLAIGFCFILTASLVLFIGLKPNERKKVISFITNKLHSIK